MSRAGTGNVEVLLHDVVSQDNGGYGADLRQLDEGTLNVRADQVKTSDNDDGDKTGLRLIQEGEGEGTLTISASEIKDGIKSENVNIIEE